MTPLWPMTPCNQKPVVSMSNTSTLYAPAAPSWTVAVTDDDSWLENTQNWANYELRQLIPASAISVSGSQARVEFWASAGINPLSITAAYIGHQGAGNAWDFDGNQVQLLFDSSASVTVSSGTPEVSDGVTFDLDSSKNLVIAWRIANNGSLDDTQREQASGWAYYFKLAGDPSVTAPTGYTANADKRICIGTVEVA